ncbi:hypothetical protein SmJEL517_g00994 [Synchytrium microbalum]|uniref:N-terminal of MaoC-like dehydratase domain-containing protein n=1 Tax=Synchytrium microbalum TaxID=1806994 RepID=A0A507C6K7_9FUNG|nr:uncharacterized protein SmJEL517_g00994 [Synchytrium microbalum]TPX37220.1 hypothetical protein SmJEL517_g00994 [Synchytrium microbalum]
MQALRNRAAFALLHRQPSIPIISRHLASHSTPQSISEAEFDQKYTTWLPTITSKKMHESDIIDAGRMHLLALTLNPKNHDGLETFIPGRPVQEAYHLTLFPPRIPEQDLALDGYDVIWSPPHPFTQRMWAGGSFEFNVDNPLRIGQRVYQSTSVDRVERKMSKKGAGASIFVWLKKQVYNEAGLAMTELRTLAYMKADRNPSAARTLPYDAPSDFSATHTPSPMTLFRYSALTFNSHLIHYDYKYCTETEGYPDLIVHGPLTCTYLLDLLVKNKPAEARIKSFSYRAVSPLVVKRPLSVHGKFGSGGKDNLIELWARSDQGSLAMKGTAELA